MVDDIAVLERLVPATDVFDALVREYDRRGDYDNDDVSKERALDCLLARLRLGTLTAWCTTCIINSTRDTGPQFENQILATSDFHHHVGAPAEVPIEFWWHFHCAGAGHRSFDPVSGDFRFEYLDHEFSHRDGGAYAVHFDPAGLPAIGVPSSPSSIVAPVKPVAAGSRDARRELVGAGEAISALAREHNQKTIGSDWQTSVEAAHKTILRRLLEGRLQAFSDNWQLGWWDAPEESATANKLSQIPAEFWSEYSQAGYQSSFDLIAGDFSFAFRDPLRIIREATPEDPDSYTIVGSRTGRAYSVAFDSSGLPQIALNSTRSLEQPVVAEASKSRGGRKPANWWPEFAEELAAYIFDNGMPATQEALITGVQSAMVSRGKEEPSRAQIQPVIRALFERLGPAEN